MLYGRSIARGMASITSIIWGATAPIVQVVWGFLRRHLISTGYYVSGSEMLKTIISIIKICVSFLKIFFL